MKTLLLFAFLAAFLSQNVTADYDSIDVLVSMYENIADSIAEEKNEEKMNQLKEAVKTFVTGIVAVPPKGTELDTGEDFLIDCVYSSLTAEMMWFERYLEGHNNEFNKAQEMAKRRLLFVIRGYPLSQPEYKEKMLITAFFAIGLRFADADIQTSITDARKRLTGDDAVPLLIALKHLGSKEAEDDLKGIGTNEAKKLELLFERIHRKSEQD